MMTLIDEGALRGALGEAASTFVASIDGVERILDEARAAEANRRWSWPRVMWRAAGRPGGLAAAAVFVLVAGALASPFIRNTGVAHPTSTSSLQSSAHAGVTPGPQGLVENGTSSGTGLTVSAGPAKRVSSPSTSTSSGSTRIESLGTVDLRVKTGAAQSSFDTLGGLAAKDKGFVVSTQVHVGRGVVGDSTFGTIVLQVPQTAFSTLVTQVQKVGRATSVQTSSNDVTSQYVDLRARITALATSRAQYLQIMTHATTIADILAVQSQLNALQSQIEQLQGQMNVLDHATTYATLSVSVSEPRRVVNGHHGKTGIARAWSDAVSGFVAGIEWLIRVSGPTLFGALLLGAILVLGRWGWRAVSRRRL